MIVGLIIAGIILAALAVMTWLVHTAPLGWEDEERGFVYGEPEDDQ